MAGPIIPTAAPGEQTAAFVANLRHAAAEASRVCTLVRVIFILNLMNQVDRVVSR
jgi:hypothetical protein